MPSLTLQILSLLSLLAITATVVSAQTQLITCGNNNPPSSNRTTYRLTFQYTLNYNFLESTPQAAAQVCQYTGPMVSHALGDDVSGPTTALRIVRLDTGDQLGYDAAGVVFSAPSWGGEILALQVLTPSSPFYNHPDKVVRSLAAQVDPSFGVRLGEFTIS